MSVDRSSRTHGPCTEHTRFRRSQMRTAVESLNPGNLYTAVRHLPVEQRVSIKLSASGVLARSANAISRVTMIVN